MDTDIQEDDVVVIVIDDEKEDGFGFLFIIYLPSIQAEHI